ncbi:MAG: ABC transporter ATP-binding protein [Candidatus Eremiobacteraeota bacterium]|nr:ABC transporter ATP-binding protein [Candidatus Eremiobacteraeota bacterium]
MTALRVANLCAAYGDTQVLWDVSLEIGEGEVVALIGSNGAGKSTLLGAVSGQVTVTGGRVAYGERDLTGDAPDAIVRAGIVQVPQGRRLFGSLSVRENLLMGAYLRSDGEIESDLERVLTLLPRLRERYEYLAGRLSGGEQQMVAIARGLMGRPKLLLLDEMSLGLAPVLVDQLLEILKEIHAQGVGILMVEQDVQTALEFSQRTYVLETGRMRLSGPSAKLLDDPEIKKAYLGV